MEANAVRLELIKEANDRLERSSGLRGYSILVGGALRTTSSIFLFRLMVASIDSGMVIVLFCVCIEFYSLEKCWVKFLWRCSYRGEAPFTGVHRGSGDEAAFASVGPSFRGERRVVGRRS